MRTCTLDIRGEDREQMEHLLHHGTMNTRTMTRVRILVKTAAGWSMAEIADAFGVSEATISTVRKRYREGGLERVLQDKQQAKRRRKFTGDGEALIVALACSPVPAGHDHWTLRMLRDKLVALEVVEQVSHVTVGAALKKMTSNRGGMSSGASPSSMPHS